MLANSVTIDVIGSDVSFAAVGELSAFAADDTLLGFATTPPLFAAEVFALSFASPDIAYVTATATTIFEVSLDNMVWEPIPAPGAALLGMIGIALVAWIKRRV